MKVIGIDPGLQVSGYAIMVQGQGSQQQSLRIVDAGVIRVSPKPALSERLVQIYHDIDDILTEHNVDFMAVEQLYAHYRHPRTAILMGHARGMFLLAAARHNLDVLDFSATRIKKSLTGNGHASKEQMQLAIQMQLELAELPKPADVADALAIAMCCINDILHRPNGI